MWSRKNDMHHIVGEALSPEPLGCTCVSKYYENSRIDALFIPVPSYFPFAQEDSNIINATFP